MNGRPAAGPDVRDGSTHLVAAQYAPLRRTGSAPYAHSAPTGTALPLAAADSGGLQTCAAVRHLPRARIQRRTPTAKVGRKGKEHKQSRDSERG